MKRYITVAAIGTDVRHNIHKSYSCGNSRDSVFAAQHASLWFMLLCCTPTAAFPAVKLPRFIKAYKKMKKYKNQGGNHYVQRTNQAA